MRAGATGCPFTGLYLQNSKATFLSTEIGEKGFAASIQDFARDKQKHILMLLPKYPPTDYAQGEEYAWQIFQKIAHAISGLNHNAMQMAEEKQNERLARLIKGRSISSAQLSSIFEYPQARAFYCYCRLNEGSIVSTLFDGANEHEFQQLLFFTIAPYYPRDHKRHAKDFAVVCTKLEDIPSRGALLDETHRWSRDQAYIYEKGFHVAHPAMKEAQREYALRVRNDYLALRQLLKRRQNIPTPMDMIQSQRAYFLACEKDGMGSMDVFERYLDIMDPTRPL